METIFSTVSEHRYDHDNNPKPRTFCLTDDQGDEFDYVLVCSFFSEDRKKLIRSYLRVTLIYINSGKLMCSHNTKVLYNLVKFFKKILIRFLFSK